MERGWPRAPRWRPASSPEGRITAGYPPAPSRNGGGKWRQLRASASHANRMSASLTLPSLGVEQIIHLLPHRGPFLFLERLTDIVSSERAVGHKAVSYNEPHFRGHFP